MVEVVQECFGSRDEGGHLRRNKRSLCQNCVACRPSSWIQCQRCQAWLGKGCRWFCWVENTTLCQSCCYLTLRHLGYPRGAPDILVGCILDYLTPKHPFNGHSGRCRIKYRTMAQPAVGKGIPAAPPSNLGLADVLKNHGTLFEQLSKQNMELQNRLTVQQQNHDAQMRMVAEEMKLMTDASKTVVARLAEMESRAGSSNAGHPTPQAPPTATVTEYSQGRCPNAQKPFAVAFENPSLEHKVLDPKPLSLEYPAQSTYR